MTIIETDGRKLLKMGSNSITSAGRKWTYDRRRDWWQADDGHLIIGHKLTLLSDGRTLAEKNWERIFTGKPLVHGTDER